MRPLWSHGMAVQPPVFLRLGELPRDQCLPNDFKTKTVGTIAESKQGLSLSEQIDDGQRFEELQHASLETCPVMATDDPRCPHCIDWDDFRRLTQYGDLLVCKSCLHFVSPWTQSSSANARTAVKSRKFIRRFGYRVTCLGSRMSYLTAL